MARIAEMVSLVTPTVIISLVSTAIAIKSFRRSRLAQEYEYATRLQIEEEKICAGGPGPGDTFYYSAQLVNVGLKPVEIDRVYIDYGGDTLDASLHFHVEGKSHISPGGKRRIAFLLSKKDYQAALAKFNLKECMFRLRIRYFNMRGDVVEAHRNLIAIGPGGTTFYAQPGDALT